MTNILVDKNKIVGTIKPMHAVGQPPIDGINTEFFHYLKDANIPYSRLHDVGGAFGGNLFVDIPNIFRDFEANPFDEKNYDFTFTDIIIKGLIENDCEPVFRLGVTIENYVHIKAYRIFPPKDYIKWAIICEHIIRHYNEGWANGFKYNIKYWEIWNEPDNSGDLKENMMWQGSMEDYFNLYRITSKRLRQCFGNSIKIGGYASSGFYFVNDDMLNGAIAMGLKSIEISKWQQRTLYFKDFFEKFIEMVVKEKLPFDFFSHHSYAGVVDTVEREKYVEKIFEQARLFNVEIHMNEWNTNARAEDLGKSIACANYVAFMIGMHAQKTALMCFYDARMTSSAYGGLFNSIYKTPYCSYFGFKAFGNLYKMGNQVETKCDNKNVYVISATGNGKQGILISNIGEDTVIKTDIKDGFKVYLINQDNFMTETNINVNEFNLKQYDVLYLEKTYKVK